MRKARWALSLVGGAVGVTGAVAGAMQIAGARSTRTFLTAFENDMRAVTVYYNSRLQVTAQDTFPDEHIEAILGLRQPDFSCDTSGHTCDVTAMWVKGAPFNELKVTVTSINPATLAVLADVLRKNSLPSFTAKNVRASFSGSTQPLTFTVVTRPNDHRDVVETHAKWRDTTGD